MRSQQKHQALPTKWEEREKLREKGQFWTPAWVADAMIQYVLTDKPDLVFDPATGSGAFAEALFRNSKDCRFWGTDIDPEVFSQKIYGEKRSTVELRDFIKNPPARKFDAIVANPPYIRHHRLDEKTKILLRQLTATIGGFTIDGRAGLHVYFLIQALHLLEKDGRLAFIMPADTCEGKFSEQLWKWISDNFCLDCVTTFAEKATPFPNVDTNAMVFFIRKAAPQASFFQCRAKEAHSTDFQKFVSSGFSQTHFPTFEVSRRNLSEALKTGFSRPAQQVAEHRHRLSDFATVLRGIATGANEFFFLTEEQIAEHGLPKQFFKRAIGRTRDAQGGIFSGQNLDALESSGRPTFLLSIDSKSDNLPSPLRHYLEKGVGLGLPERPLIQQRNPWFKMEKREIPEILFAYLGRRNARFIKNEAGVLPLTGFLCVYPIYKDETFVNNLHEALNHPDTLANLSLVGKSYGSGAIKVEPSNLRNLPIPEKLVEQYDLKRPFVSKHGQLDLFQE